MPKMVLVTGGAGFIGSHLVRRLLDDGARVRVVDNLSTGNARRLDALCSRIDFIEGDLADDSVARKVVDGVDFVLHQAAVPSVQRSVVDPIGTNKANVTATLNLLEDLHNAQCAESSTQLLHRPTVIQKFCRSRKLCRRARYRRTHCKSSLANATVKCITICTDWRR